MTASLRSRVADPISRLGRPALRDGVRDEPIGGDPGRGVEAARTVLGGEESGADAVAGMAFDVIAVVD
jgi:hypothetical protein